jgi:hypothetical protein
MARIKGKDLYLNDDDQIYFGDNKEAAMWFEDNELQLDHTVSGIDPASPGHLVTKRYVDNLVTSSGVGSTTFIELTDTPISYSNSAGQVAVVNAAEDGIEFVTQGIYNIDGGFANSMYGGVPSADGGGA